MTEQELHIFSASISEDPEWKSVPQSIRLSIGRIVSHMQSEHDRLADHKVELEFLKDLVMHLSGESPRFTNGELTMAVITAFILGAGTSSGVGLLAGNGTINRNTLYAILISGVITAARDYRSLKRIPAPRINGNGTK